MSVFLLAGVELAFVFLIVLLAKSYLSLTLLLPLLNRSCACVPSILFFRSFLHYARMDLLLQLLLLHCCLLHNLFLFLS